MGTEASELSLHASRPLEPIAFICWRWQPVPGYRSKFSPHTIAVLQAMLARNYKGPHELICVTDRPAEVPHGIRAIKLWDDFSNIPSPHGGAYPSCYRRLKMFSREAADFIRAPRFASIDLDVVITDDITPLFSDPGDFKMYGDTARGTPYNGSLIYNRIGTRSQLWEKFDPKLSPRQGLARRYIGSDQAWIGVCLGPNERKFTARDGVYSYRNEILPKGGHLPAGARMVIFHGAHDPWSPFVQARHSWVKKHYR
jgi:hypothetical protein